MNQGRRSELAEPIKVALWAYMLTSPSTPDELCEVIVTALAAEGHLRGHEPSPVRVTTVEGHL